MSIDLTAETRIADLIAADPAALDRLASFHPVFSAMRTAPDAAALPSLGEAARSADLPLQAILAIARGEVRVDKTGCGGCGCGGGHA